jgi:hypothetical protein
VLISEQEPNKLQKALFVDGIKYSILITTLAYDKLRSDLLTLSRNDFVRRTKAEESLSNDDSFSYKISAISNAWQIIDSIHRLDKLLRKTPGLKQNSTELQVFYTQTANVKWLRNNIQHLNEQIRAYVHNKIPAWGTLNWVARLNEDWIVFSLVPGELFERNTPFLNPCGRQIDVPIGLITLCVDREICLSELIEGPVKNVTKWLEAVLGTSITGMAPQSMLASAELNLNS